MRERTREGQKRCGTLSFAFTTDEDAAWKAALRKARGRFE
jgi:hypothetical protein